MNPRAVMDGLITCKTYELSWNGPFGPVTLTVTDTKTFFNRHHIVDITVPPGTPLPLETLSYVATGTEIECAGGAKGFVESLIAAAESTAAWREYAARGAGGRRHERHQNPASRPRPGRRRLKLGALRR